MSIHASSRLAIVCEFGFGYANTFLNGLKVVRFDGHKTEVIGSRSYCCYFYNDEFVRKEAAEIVSDFLKKQLAETDEDSNASEIMDVASRLVKEAMIS